MIELAVDQADGQTVKITMQRTMEVRLDQFSDEAIITYLRDRGYGVDGERKEPVVITRKVYMDGEHEDRAGDELCVIEADVIEHAALLSLCGQREAGRELIIDAVNYSTGKRI